jgi:uncharacterized OB-fold protein
MHTEDANPSQRAEPAAPPTIGLLRCGKCRQLTYPATAYGCNSCGAPRNDGETIETPARGMLRNWIMVHVDMVAGVKAPYVVGEVEIAPGVIEQVLIDATDEPGLAVGQTLVAVAAATESEPWLRFVPEGRAA